MPVQLQEEVPTHQEYKKEPGRHRVTTRRGRTTTKKEWGWTRSQQKSGKEKDEEAAALKWSRLPEDIFQSEAVRDAKVPWKLKTEWLNKRYKLQ